MKRFSTLLLVAAVVSSVAFGQLTITSTTPTNGTTNVSLSTTVSITFSAPLDDSWGLNMDRGAFTNADITGSPTYSLDKRTVNFPVTLTAGQVYFFVVSYAKAGDGTTLTVPYVFYFTPGSAFPTTTVSGTVTAGTAGVDPSHCLVVLSRTDPNNDDPDLFMGTVAEASGAFTLPYVANGGYYPIAAKDVDNDGSINAKSGDALGFSDSITVSGTNITGVQIALRSYPSLYWQAAIDSAAVLAAALPADRELRFVQAWNIDSLGRSPEWSFFYVSPSLSIGAEIQIRNMSTSVNMLDPWWYSWMTSMKPITNLAGAASASAFITNVENAGGRLFRREAHPDSLTLSTHIYLGDLANSELGHLVTNNNILYWGAVYTWGVEKETTYTGYKSMHFLGDYFNGFILGTTDVRPVETGTVPEKMALQQNYPNPFNPATKIGFSLPVAGQASLKVFNLVGQEVATLFEGTYDRGTYEVQFDGARLPSGMYIYVLRSNGSTLVQKMALVK
jgi:methionine-rich copper-binding protein CopC